MSLYDSLLVVLCMLVYVCVQVCMRTCMACVSMAAGRQTESRRIASLATDLPSRWHLQREQPPSFTMVAPA